MVSVKDNQSASEQPKQATGSVTLCTNEKQNLATLPLRIHCIFPFHFKIRMLLFLAATVEVRKKKSRKEACQSGI